MSELANTYQDINPDTSYDHFQHSEEPLERAVFLLYKLAPLCPDRATCLNTAYKLDSLNNDLHGDRSSTWWLHQEIGVTELAKGVYDFDSEGWMGPYFFDKLYDGHEYIYFVEHEGHLLYIGISRRISVRFEDHLMNHYPKMGCKAHVLDRTALLRYMHLPNNVTLETLETLCIDLCMQDPNIDLTNKKLSDERWVPYQYQQRYQH
jgi:hypothetical protein